MKGEIELTNKDSAELLKQCNAGIKMGVSSIDDVLDNIKSEDLKNILTENKEEHQNLGSRTHELLEKLGEEGKEPNPMAKGMSWIKTNVMLSINDTDNMVADLITDGCNMGVKSLNRYLNQYKAADDESKKLAKQLIDLEHQLTIDIRPYL